MKPVICFDWDGTLCDSMSLCINENRTTLARLGLPPQPDEVLRQCNGPTFEEAAPIIGIPPERMEEYCRVRLAAALELVPVVNRLFDGVYDLLDALRGKAEVCIVSNGTAEYLSLCMKTFGLEGAFARIVPCHPERTKAQNLALLLADYPGAPAVMVGDRLGDLRAGNACGIPTIAAAYGYGNDAEYALADHRAGSMEELTELLLRFAGGQPL